MSLPPTFRHVRPEAAALIEAANRMTAAALAWSADDTKAQAAGSVALDQLMRANNDAAFAQAAMRSQTGRRQSEHASETARLKIQQRGKPDVR